MRLLKDWYKIVIPLAVWGLLAIVVAQVQAPVHAQTVKIGTGTFLGAGNGSPEGSIYGNKGDTWYRTDGLGQVYNKTTDGGNTGWALPSAGSASSFLGLSTVAQGDVLYASATDTLVALAKSTSATRYLSNTGSSNNPAWAQVDLSNGVTGTLPVSALGTTGTPQFARVGIGNAADATLGLKGTSGAWVCALVNEGNSSTSLTIDLAGGCNEHLVTLTGSVTFTFTNPTDGGRYVFILDTGAGSFTVTWPGDVQWPAGTAPTITATASKVDIVTCIYRSGVTSYYCAFNQNYPQ